METTEKIVEAYARYVRGWLTLPNIKCTGQYEIDLLAVDVQDPKKIKRYHIESGISISGGFSHLTNRPYSPDEIKKRLSQSSQRRTLGYFVERKFGSPEVLDRLKHLGFTPGNYRKIIVSWGWESDVPDAARKAGVELWHFKDLLCEIATKCKADTTYFTDDTMRTLQLMTLALRQKPEAPLVTNAKAPSS